VHDLPKLEYMDLKRTQIGNSSLRHLNERTNIWWLDVRETAVTDEGIAHLANVPSLRKIEIDAGQASPTTIDELRRALPHCTLLVHESEKGSGRHRQ
jgi:hypothetical protein